MARRLASPISRPRTPARRLQRRLVDRAMRLAGNQGAAAEQRIVARQRAGAPDQAVAALDDDVGIGADERQVARRGSAAASRHSPPASRSRRRTGRCRQRRRLELVDQIDVEPVIDRKVAIGAEMIDAARAGRDQVAGHVAGGDDRVPRAVRNAQRSQLRDDVGARPRRIGDQHDGQPSSRAQRQRRGRRRKGAHAIVDHAPDVAQDRRIARRDVLQRADDRRQLGHALTLRISGCRRPAIDPPRKPGH